MDITKQKDYQRMLYIIPLEVCCTLRKINEIYFVFLLFTLTFAWKFM